jgi:hypothetical protein
MGVDVLDFTALEKRGLLKKREEHKEIDVLDLRPSASAPVIQAQPVQETSAFDFLTNFAQSSASSPATEPIKSTDSDISLKLYTITNKLDDTMYKIEMLSSRLAQLESRLR